MSIARVINVLYDAYGRQSLTSTCQTTVYRASFFIFLFFTVSPLFKIQRYLLLTPGSKVMPSWPYGHREFRRVGSVSEDEYLQYHRLGRIRVLHFFSQRRLFSVCSVCATRQMRGDAVSALFTLNSDVSPLPYPSLPLLSLRR